MDVRDFHAPDDIWALVEPYIKHGNVLCYNCFTDLCLELKLVSFWDLVIKKYCEYCAARVDVDLMEYASPMNLACPRCYENAHQENIEMRLQSSIAGDPPFNTQIEFDKAAAKARDAFGDYSEEGS